MYTSYTLIVQIKTTANKGDVFMIGSFFFFFFWGGGGTKKIEILGWKTTNKDDAFMNFLHMQEQIMTTFLYLLK